MAESLPSPPISRRTTPAAIGIDEHSQAELEDYLDSLLEQYLGLLDEYSVLQKSLSTQFANGFLTLASAQRHANMGSGRRYGRDGYDNRMKAIRTMRLVPEQSGRSIDRPAHGAVNDTFTVSCHEAEYVPKVEPDAPESESGKPNGGKGCSKSRHRDNKGHLANRDPTTWFGILVPPALRQTQQHFVTVVEQTIPQILSLRASMQHVESKIWETRASLGMSHMYTEMPKEEGAAAEASSLKDIDRLLAKAKLQLET